MKHIYLINTGARAAQYGIGTYVKQVVEFLKNNSSLHVSVINLNSEEKEFKVMQDNSSVRRFEIPMIGYSGRKTDEERYYRNIVYLMRPHILLSDQNIFHFNYLHHAPLARFFRNIDTNCLIMITIHYFDWCFELRGNVTRFRSLLSKLADEREEKEKRLLDIYERDKSFFQEADRIVCLSIITYQLLHKYYNLSDKKMEVLYNGLKDEAICLNEKERQEQKKALLFHDSDRIILFVGRLDEVKGLDSLIKAFHKVLEEVPDARLIIAGDGNYNFYLKECTNIWNRVIFTGKINKEQLYKFYQIADLGVMPSFHEQCSYVAIEMMMHGIPLIGTDSTGLGEMVGEDSGRLIQLQETEEDVILPIEDLAADIVNMLSSPIDEIRKNSRKRYEMSYLLNDMEHKMITIYN